MFSQRREGSGAGFWILAAGLAAGLTAAIWYGARRRDRQTGASEPTGAFFELEDAVIEALRTDDALQARPIDVAGIAPGIIELTGTVETEEEAHHAVEVVQAVTGVRTVLNRLDLSEFENRLQRASSRAGAGSGSRWYGMGVGMGRRRQSAATDPAQRDDHAAMLEDAIGPDPDEIIADLNEERVGEPG